MRKLLLISILLFSFNAQSEIKNSQNILDSLLTRAGVRNMKPLNHTELTSLCEQGYTNAFFLYRGASETRISCSRGSIHYRNSGDYRAPEVMTTILNHINSGLSSGNKTFVHCYNGAHASGFVAAVALRTFCGISSESAVKYWNQTLNGYPLQEPNRSQLMNRLRNFPIRTELELSTNQKVQFGCPN